MTIPELENKLPNGFHDSFLVSLTANFTAGTACIELDVDHDDPDPEAFRRMTLRLKGLSLFVVDQPDVRSALSFGRTIWVSGHETDEKMMPNLEAYRKNAPAGSFFYSFFLHHWNCFIHLAATDAELDPALEEASTA
ncbi:MAG: hypothetical protein ACLQLC_13975 [Candidatus Sulfotelmatobacter sp.]